ncbi:hypothetical protein IJ541_06635 [bacterium]|nr:hypothetical protein [bacterium]
MAKDELKNSIWFVLADGIKIYFTNIDKFVMYMLFPVFGQIAGILLAFGLSLGFADKVIAKTDSPVHALIFVILLALPGLLIFAKAFWDFMVAYVALNSMTEGAINTGKVYDFQSHNEVATRRTFKFVLLLLAVGILSSLATSIFFIIPGFVLWIYFILVYQVFTFEPELSIQDCFKRSFVLIRGNWLRTLILMLILTFFSIYIITEGITVVFDYLNLTDKICSLFTPFTNMIPLDFTNKVLVYLKLPIITPEIISRTVFFSILSFIVTGLTLPIRSICWTLWYMSGVNEKNNIEKKLVRKKREQEVV